MELPFHSFKTDKLQFETSSYLTDLTWLHNKIDATGCVQLVNDIYLLSAPHVDGATIAIHLEFLKRFLEIHAKQLNYDAQQLNKMFKFEVEMITQIALHSKQTGNPNRHEKTFLSL